MPSEAEILQELHWRLSEESPHYFCENFVSISTPNKGRVLFKISERQYQSDVISLLHDPTNRRIISLKSRQIGLTTICANFTLWDAFFHQDRYDLFISRREEDAKSILRKTSYAYRWLPDWMQERGPQRMDDASQRMTFSNDSMIRSEPSQSDPARGSTATLIIVDEFAFLQNQEDAWSSIEPVADIGGRLFLLSTANGSGDLFHTLWQGAVTDRNGFVPVFIPWSAVPERDEAWFEDKVNSLLPWIRAQEYPSDPEEAFVQSGAMVFDLDALRRHELAVLTPEWYQLDEMFEAESFAAPIRERDKHYASPMHRSATIVA